jgi:protein-tyrosine kinase
MVLAKLFSGGQESENEAFQRLVVVEDPNSIEAEAIRALRTRIMARHVREGRRALTMCAATAGVGCTFVAANLAASVAQIGIKTAIVDADLREPAVHNFLPEAKTGKGLADYLADSSLSIDDVIKPANQPALSIVPAGTLVANPQELLSSERFKSFVDQMLREFDLTIFDTTPTSGCTDAQRIATVSVYSMIVARRHKSFMKDVSTLSGLLRADRSVVVGSVLNEF